MARPLMFSKKYLDKLLQGSKLATIRVGKVGYREGDVVLVYCGGLLLGRARIVRVARKALKDLDEGDAIKDGFSSVDELLRALRSHYSRLGKNTPLTLLEFEWVERFDNPPSDTSLGWPYSVTPVEAARLALENVDLTDEEAEILKTVVELGSIRRAARRMGGAAMRRVVRGVLRRAAEALYRRGLIGVRDRCAGGQV